jgi:hypothetical protein
MHIQTMDPSSDTCYNNLITTCAIKITQYTLKMSYYLSNRVARDGIGFCKIRLYIISVRRLTSTHEYIIITRLCISFGITRRDIDIPSDKATTWQGHIPIVHVRHWRNKSSYKEYSSATNLPNHLLMALQT